MDKQRRIVAYLDGVQAQAAAAEEELARLEESILARVFRGEV
jgi:hypothetical protein